MVVRYIQKGSVGYEVVGSPTIVDGVVSGFSSSNYLTTSLSISQGSFIGNIRAKFAAGGSGYSGMFVMQSDSKRFSIERNGTHSIRVYHYDSVNNTNTSTGISLQSDSVEDMWLDYTFVHNLTTHQLTLTVTNVDTQEVLQTQTFENYEMASDSSVVFGYLWRAFEGSIDLNETYIKVNGKMWFGNSVFIPRNQILSKPYDETVLLEGEPAFEKDTNSIKVGNGEDTYDELPYLVDNSGEWRKPKEWVDIRSGAIPNSVYFLVGHSADYATYPQFIVQPTVSDSGTYDVFVDGIKVATTNSNTKTTLDWATLLSSGTIAGGYNVTYPSELVTHIVRVTPTLDSNTFTAFIAREASVGVLWVHITATNYINLNTFLGAYGDTTAKIVEAVTSMLGEIKANGLGNSFNNCKSLKYIDPIDFNNNTYSPYAFYNCNKVNRIVIKNLPASSSAAQSNMFQYCSALKEIVCESATISSSASLLTDCASLLKLPNVKFVSGATVLNPISGCTSLKDTVLDLSYKNDLTRASLAGSSTKRIDGLKGVTVSNEAPFDNATSPQINVSYTGMDRNALVNLFKSMPYNVGYTVVGSPTITDGVASGFSRNNYIRISNLNFNLSSFEIVTKLKLPSVSGWKPIQHLWNNFQGGLAQSNGYFYWAVQSSNFGNTYLKCSNVLAEIDAWYYIKQRKDGNTLSISISTDGANWQDARSVEVTDLYPFDNVILYGQNQNYGFEGSIDLNETYIKVNGVPWFRGTAAMTKTCNIVGCTGTADLTQEDKNIALDKGWELMIA